ncbi:hypothetical protein N0V90_008609 [Kalmusia sp. IMI 367209]|nr:hypothetical protein N0V90_008609 [Kalmusia sp. IMI 367209]
MSSLQCLDQATYLLAQVFAKLRLHPPDGTFSLYAFNAWLVELIMSRPRANPSDTMTSITPPSLADDGLSLDRRMPCGGRAEINKWLEGTATLNLPPASATSGSTYTGSFIDDGADMLAPSHMAPGFGVVDRKFYKRGKPKESADAGEWTVEMEKALAGDMWRSLARMKSIARVEIRHVEDLEQKKERRARKKDGIEEDGRVRIMKPLRWGTFIIEGEDGRVVIVDEEGEYDSGAVGERVEWERKSKERFERKEKEKVHKTGVEATSLEQNRGGLEEEKHATSRERQRKAKHHRHRRRSSPPTKPLSPIPEADTPEESASAASIISPTNFFMTGAQSGLLSPVPSIRKSPVLHISPTHSPPGAWPSPLPSPVKSVPSMKSLNAATISSTTTSANKSEESWTERKSWGQEASAVKLPSSVSSPKYSDATSSTTSAGASQDSWKKVNAWNVHVGKQSPRGSPKRGSSCSKDSITGSKDSWKRAVDAFDSRVPHKKSSSPTRSPTPPLLAWDQDQEAENNPAAAIQSPRISTVSRTSAVVTPYSWRREVEELSTYSEAGSNGSRSRAPSPVRSNDSWKEGGREQSGHRDGDVRSVVSHSTYKAPTVEDAPDSLQDGASGRTGWNMGDSQRGSDRGSDSRASLRESAGVKDRESEVNWDGRRASVAGSVEGGAEWSASVIGSGAWKDKSGFDEDNDAWLNSVVGGDKYREAEWQSAPEGSWRDV